MIFSRFFTPDHAKPDPAIRKAAVSQLSPDDPKSKRILHELAFNDAAADVNLAALEHLDSFSLWQKTAQTSSKERVKKAAKQKVNKVILSGQGIAPELRQTFLQESADTELVAQVLMEDDVIVNNTSLALKLLERVNKPRFRDAFFTGKATPEIQRALLREENDVTTLQKWHKKSSPEQQAEIESKLLHLQAIKQKPIELAKTVTLLLSKLQALVEHNDYEVFSKVKQELEQEYSALSKEFECLKERERDAFVDKKDKIDARLSNVNAKLKADYDALIHERNKEQTNHELNVSLRAIEERVGALMANIEGATLEQLETLQNDAEELQQRIKLSQDVLGVAVCEPLSQKLSSLNLKLSKLPEWQRHTNEMNALLTSMEDSSVQEANNPENINSVVEDYKSRFNDLFETGSPLSEQQRKRFNSIKKVLLDAKRRYEKSIASETAELRTFLNITGNLIEQGKFRPAMAKFAKLNALWEQKSEAVKQSVERRYNEVSAQIDKLEGWQEYLAAPRKPALLEQASALIDDTSRSLVERAQQIKLLRKQWQSLSLGKNSKDNADELENAFDEVLEKAFAPCRAYFAEQDEKRKKAIAQREELIQELVKIAADQETATAEKFAAFEQLQKQWRACDTLPPSDYQVLKTRYDESRHELNKNFAPWLDENAKSKKRLIDSVDDLLNVDELSEAANKAKQLQQQWRSVPSAGRKNDTNLWRKFRQANDAIFAKINASRDAQKEANDTNAELLRKKLAEFSDAANTLTPDVFQQQLNALYDEASSLPKHLKMPLQQAMDALKRRTQQYQLEKELQAEQQKTQALVALLRDTCDKTEQELTTHENWQQIDKRWRDALLSSDGQDEGALTREDSLILFEASLGLPSPKSDSERRAQLQMELLAANMGQGKAPDATHYLFAWLSCGVVSGREVDMLERLEICLHTLRERT